jgi:hypothetical protein
MHQGKVSGRISNATGGPRGGIVKEIMTDPQPGKTRPMKTRPQRPRNVAAGVRRQSEAWPAEEHITQTGTMKRRLSPATIQRAEHQAYDRAADLAKSYAAHWEREAAKEPATSDGLARTNGTLRIYA